MEDVRRNWPFLRDRRIDSYAPDHQQANRLTRTVNRSNHVDGSPTVQGEQSSPSLWCATSLTPIHETSPTSYRMPAEWEPHASTWLAWPHYRGDWPGKFEPIPWVYAEIIRHLARHERVDLIVNNAPRKNKPARFYARRTL